MTGLPEQQRPTEPHARAHKPRHRLLPALVVLAVIVNPFSALVLFGMVALNSPAVAEGPSMEPTVHDGTVSALDVLTYRTREPERGDIVILSFAPFGETRLVKRIVGLPGEELVIRGDRVFIDGLEIEEPYLRLNWSDRVGPVRIPDDEYFVMGDNRANSFDSRDPLLGTIPRSNIEGRLVTEFTPWLLALGLLIGAVVALGIPATAAISLTRHRGPWWGLLGVLGGAGLALVYFAITPHGAPRPIAPRTPAGWPQGPGAPPPLSTPEAPAPVLAAGVRLRELRRLHEEGLLTDEDFRRRRREIAADM